MVNWKRAQGGFTLAEVLVAITLIGLGISAAVGSLTKLNAFASMSRNSTGAYTAVMNQVDLFESLGPFNPQKKNDDGTWQVPPEMTIGTHTIDNVPIYREPSSGIVVPGTMTTVVSDASVAGIIMYRAVVTVTYRYLGRPNGPQYSFSMTTLRASDT